MYGYYGLGCGFNFLGTIVAIFWWILMFYVLVTLLRYLKQNNLPKKNTALEILKEKYAKGEIDKVEFEQKRKDISDSPS